jgi:hypothetical protein
MHAAAVHQVIFDKLHETAYRKCGLGRTILGPESNIQSITRDDLVRFVKTHYTGHRVVVSGAGAVDHSQVLCTERCRGASRCHRVVTFVVVCFRVAAGRDVCATVRGPAHATCARVRRARRPRRIPGLRPSSAGVCVCVRVRVCLRVCGVQHVSGLAHSIFTCTSSSLAVARLPAGARRCWRGDGWLEQPRQLRADGHADAAGPLGPHVIGEHEHHLAAVQGNVAVEWAPTACVLRGVSRSACPVLLQVVEDDQLAHSLSTFNTTYTVRRVTAALCVLSS